MEIVDDFTNREEFESTKTCDFCNSKEGRIRMVGNYVVKLSGVKVEGTIKLACQSCKIKELNFRKAYEKNQKNKSFLKSLLRLGF